MLFKGKDMRERRFDFTLLQALWWDDGELTTLLGIEFSFDPDRPDTSLLSASFRLPGIDLHVYSGRWPILDIDWKFWKRS